MRLSPEGDTSGRVPYGLADQEVDVHLTKQDSSRRELEGVVRWHLWDSMLA